MKIANDNTQMHRSKGAARCAAQQRIGFTLVEMMVTLAIMMLLFGIIFVPLNQAFNFFQLGQTRTSMQQAARQVLEQISGDLRTAVRMFPNDITPGITNQAPYSSVGPYINRTSCGPTPESGRLSNLSRIDFIPAQVDNKGAVITPVKPARYLVTYYARRFDTTKDYDAVTNPVLLFRAQSPYRNANDTEAETPSGDLNMDIKSTRYSSCSGSGRSVAWLMQQNGEPNFQAPWSGPSSTPAITSDTADGQVPGSHTRALPLGVSLTAPLAIPPTNVTPVPPPNYTPLTTFTLTDANDDGSEALEKYLNSEEYKQGTKLDNK